MPDAPFMDDAKSLDWFQCGLFGLIGIYLGVKNHKQPSGKQRTPGVLRVEPIQFSD